MHMQYTHTFTWRLSPVIKENPRRLMKCAQSFLQPPSPTPSPQTLVASLWRLHSGISLRVKTENKYDT